MIKILKEVIGFYKNPVDTRLNDLSYKNQLKYILQINCILIFIGFIFLIPIYIASELGVYKEDISNINYKETTFLYTLIVIVIVGPILEEMVFRFPIRYNKLYNLFINRKIWNYLFKLLVYILPILFGLIHICNYNLTNSPYIILSVPFLIGGQIISGYLYTFLRVKINFMSALIAHSMNNFIITLFIIILIPFNKYEEITDEYTVEIKTHEYSNIENAKITLDTLNNKIYYLESKEYSINHLIDSLFKMKRKKEDYLLDIKVESKKGISKDDFLKIIEKVK